MVNGENVPNLKIKNITEQLIDEHCYQPSQGGTGGMASKLRNAKEAIESGVTEVWILNGKKPEQLYAVLNGKHAGTKITR